MTDTFDAVLAEMLETADVRDLRDGAVHTELVREWRDRLTAAHAAEVAERDARIAALEADKKAMFIRAREWATRSGEQEQRVEAAERDARRLDWLLRNGKEIVFFVGGDLYCYTHMDDDERGECRVAIDAAIATTEQDHD